MYPFFLGEYRVMAARTYIVFTRLVQAACAADGEGVS